jgi:hypothetical protein
VKRASRRPSGSRQPRESKVGSRPTSCVTPLTTAVDSTDNLRAVMAFARHQKPDDRRIHQNRERAASKGVEDGETSPNTEPAKERSIWRGSSTPGRDGSRAGQSRSSPPRAGRRRFGHGLLASDTSPGEVVDHARDGARRSTPGDPRRLPNRSSATRQLHRSGPPENEVRVRGTSNHGGLHGTNGLRWKG